MIHYADHVGNLGIGVHRDLVECLAGTEQPSGLPGHDKKPLAQSIEPVAAEIERNAARQCQNHGRQLAVGARMHQQRRMVTGGQVQCLDVRHCTAEFKMLEQSIEGGDVFSIVEVLVAVVERLAEFAAYKVFERRQLCLATVQVLQGAHTNARKRGIDRPLCGSHAGARRLWQRVVVPGEKAQAHGIGQIEGKVPEHPHRLAQTHRCIGGNSHGSTLFVGRFFQAHCARLRSSDVCGSDRFEFLAACGVCHETVVFGCFVTDHLHRAVFLQADAAAVLFDVVRIRIDVHERRYVA